MGRQAECNELGSVDVSKTWNVIADELIELKKRVNGMHGDMLDRFKAMEAEQTKIRIERGASFSSGVTSEKERVCRELLSRVRFHSAARHPGWIKTKSVEALESDMLAIQEAVWLALERVGLTQALIGLTLRADDPVASIVLTALIEECFQRHVGDKS